jgi:hypothetical protein
MVKCSDIILIQVIFKRLSKCEVIFQSFQKLPWKVGKELAEESDSRVPGRGSWCILMFFMRLRDR